MPKTAGTIAIMLTLITGMLIGQLHLLAGSRVATIPARPSETVDEHVAFDFYDALNLAFRTGDVGELRVLVAPGFIERSAASPTEGSLESLERYALSLHRKTPEATLKVNEVTVEGTMIAVRLRMEGVSDLTVAGLPLDSELGDNYELLRIENGKVIERWSGSSLPPMIETLGNLDIATSTGWLREPRLERLDFAPGAELSVEEHEGTILRVESGSLVIGTSPSDAPTALAGRTDETVAQTVSSHVLETGESISIPANEPFHIRNSGNQGASLIWLGIRRVDAQLYPAEDGTLSETPSRIERVLIAGGASIRPEQGPFLLTAERMVAVPGASIPIHSTDEFELLLVESGTVDVVIHDKFVFIVTNRGTLRTEKESLQLETDQGISVPLAVDLEYTVTGDEPAIVWVITVQPL